MKGIEKEVSRFGEWIGGTSASEIFCFIFHHIIWFIYTRDGMIPTEHEIKPAAILINKSAGSSEMRLISCSVLIIGSTDTKIHTSRWRQVGSYMLKKHSKIRVGFVNFQ